MTGKFALVFGNTQYADPALAQLTAPGKDAEDLARVLKAPDLCGFDEVTVCLNERSSSAIEAIDGFFDARKPDDLLVLYFSGHGIRDELGSLYLAFSNTIRSRLRSTALKAEYVREAMDESRSKRQVLVLDCCNSGAFPSGAKADLSAAMGMTAALQGYGRYVLTASDATQFAWEGDRMIGETSNSLFTHFLVKGLEGEADQDGDGSISVDDLYDYAFRQISRITPKQTPTKSASKQEGDIVLRQITRLEDIKRMSLPDELMEAIADSRTFVREGAVQQLAKLLGGRNLGLARSAREALEKICAEDDSLRVRKAATDALAPLRAAEQQAREQAEAERLAREKAESERLAALKVQEELAAQQKVEDERFAREREADRLAAVKAQEEQLARAKAEQERLGREKAQAELLAKRKAEEELAAQMGMAQQKLRLPWLPALGIGLGYAASPILQPILHLDLQVGRPFFGAVSGLIMGAVLYRVRLLTQWRSVIGILVTWAVVSGIGSAIIAPMYDSILIRIVLSLCGALEGLILAGMLYRERVVRQRLSMLWITLAWLIAILLTPSAMSAARAILITRYWNVADAIAAILCGGLAGFVIMLLIRAEPRQLEHSLLAALNALQNLVAQKKSQEPQHTRERAGQVRPVEQNLRPRWVSVLWFGFAFAASPMFWPLIRPDVLIGDALFGAATGSIAAFGLYRERTLKQHLSLLWIALGWAAAWTISGVVLSATRGDIDIRIAAAIAGVLMGITLALVLYREQVLSHPAFLLGIILAWTIVRAAEQVAFQTIAGWLVAVGFSNLLVRNTIIMVLCGALGGVATIFLMRKANAQEAGKAQDQRPAAAGQNLHPRWRSLLWIALGSAIGGAILSIPISRTAIAENVIDFVGCGLCIGLPAALVLRLEHVLTHWRSVLWIALGWSVAWAIGAPVTIAAWGLGNATAAFLVLSWAIGGFVTGVVLRGEHALSSLAGVWWITLAWAFGGVIFTLVILLTLADGSIASNYLIALFAVAGALGGAIGGAGTIWLIRKSGGKAAQLAAG